MHKTEIFQIDLKKVFKNKAPKTANKIPNFVFLLLEKIICQDELNRVLRTYYQLEGIDFMEAMVKDYNIKLSIHGIENIKKDGRYIFASNHPLGGMDGVCLTSILGRAFDYKVKCLVNDVLLYVPALRPPFVAINKYGNQSRESAQKVNEAFNSDNQIITFPAGLVSRRHNGIVSDSEWKKAFITKARESKRDIVPIFFNGTNSNFFYNFSIIRKALKIKFNIELFLLPREMVKSKNKTFDIYIGTPIPWQQLDSRKSDTQWAEWIKELAYNLPNKN